MSFIEIFDWDYNEETEMVSVEAQVEDAVMSSPATLYDPAQWQSGRCIAEILWPTEFEPPTLERIEQHLISSDPNWELIPFDQL